MTAFCEHTKFDPDVEQWSGAGGLIMLRILQQRPQIEEGGGGVDASFDTIYIPSH